MTAFLDAQADDLPDDERSEPARRPRQWRWGGTSPAWRPRSTGPPSARAPRWSSASCPSDAMLGAALAAQPSLHERALAQRVVLVGPGALMALLRTVAFTWQQDALSASARELLDLGRDLHRRLATLGRAHGEGRPQPAVQRRGLQRHGRRARVARHGHRPADARPRPRRRRDPGAHPGRDRSPAADVPGAHRRRHRGGGPARPAARPRRGEPSPATATPAEPAARPRPPPLPSDAPCPTGGNRRGSLRPPRLVVVDGPRREAHGGPLQSSDCHSRLVGRQGTLDNGGTCPFRAPSVENGGP